MNNNEKATVERLLMKFGAPVTSDNTKKLYEGLLTTLTIVVRIYLLLFIVSSTVGVLLLGVGYFIGSAVSVLLIIVTCKIAGWVNRRIENA